MDEKNPDKNLANIIIIKYSFTFWIGSVALEVYMANLEVLTIKQYPLKVAIRIFPIDK